MSDTGFLSHGLREELRATMRLALPMAGANLIQMGIYAVDVMFVARLGPESLAASSLATSTIGLLVWSSSGLLALSPLVAAELGRRSHSVREVRRTTRMTLWIAVAVGCIIAGLLQFSRPFLAATGQPADLVERAGAFLAVLGLSALPMLLASVLRMLCASLDRPIYSTVINALGLCANALGNWLLVFGHWGFPALGLTGSAIASIVTAWLMVAAYVVVIAGDRRLRRYHIWGRWWRSDWPRLADVLRIGIPIAATILAEAGLFSGAAFMMGRIGEVQLAGHAIALQVAALAFQVPMAVSQAATIRVGLSYGARDSVGIARAGQAGFLVGIAFMAVTAGLMLLFPRAILGLYVDADAAANAGLIVYAVLFLKVAAAFQLFDGTQAVAGGALRGLQDTRVPMWIAIAGYWLGGMATSLLLGFFTPLGGLGIWIGLMIGLIIVALLLGLRWRRRESLSLVPHPD